MSNQLLSLTAKQLRRAAGVKERLETLNKELASILGTPALPAAKRVKRRKMSGDARAKIAAAQKARWAKIKKAKPAAKAPAKKRKMSAAAKAKLSASAKARWAKVKAAGKTTL